MARTVSEIQSQIIGYIEADATLSAKLTSPSKFSVWRLFTFVVASVIAVFEQILDANTANVESIAKRTPISTESWWIQKAKEFQYSTDTPQVLSIIDNVPQYETVDESLQIITASAIVSPDFKRNVIKVAKGDIEDLQPLDTQEYNAFLSYIDEISPAGLLPNVLSEDADLLAVYCQIYFDGQYNQEDVKEDCITAVNEYLQGLDFNGNVFVNGIIDAIQGVQGVNDVVLNDVDIRDYTESFGGGTALVDSNEVLLRFKRSVAGYIKEEIESGNTFADTFTMIQG